MTPNPPWLQRLRRRQSRDRIDELEARLRAAEHRNEERRARQRRHDAAMAAYQAAIRAQFAQGAPWFELPIEILLARSVL